MKQQSLFPNPPDLKADVSKPDLLKDFISTKKPLVLKPVKSSRLDQIYLPENKGLIQTQIPLGRQFDYPGWVFPTIYRTEDKVREIISKSYESGRLGLDFEFDPSSNRISIIGVAVRDICAACRYTRNLGETLIRAAKAGVVLVGHFVLGADKEVLEKDLDIETPLDFWDDSMIWHYLLRACLTKRPGKEENEGAAGFMGLGFAAHLWTYLPNYKDCRGLGCQPKDYPTTKIPCPAHDVLGYCALDSWAGLMVADKAQEESEVKKIPPRVYEEHAVLACNFCIAAEKRGFDLDHEYIKKLSSEMEEEKEKIFPGNSPFNPRSDKQVKEYFKARGVNLNDTQRETVEKELEKVIASYGIEDIEAWNKLSEDEKPDLAEGGEQELAKLHLYKTLGKGVKAWFGENFIHKDGKLHPRFIFTGASTMRMSMSRPNCFSADTEILTKRGWVEFPYLYEDDVVAQYCTETNEVSFVPPTNYVLVDNVSETLYISTKEQLSLAVTPDHQCLLRDRKTGEFRKYDADKFPEDMHQIGAGRYVGGSVKWQEWQVILQCAFQADGHRLKLCSAVEFTFRKPRKIERLRAALICGGIDFRESTTISGKTRFYIGANNFPTYFRKYWGEWILDFDRDTLDMFANEIFFWDGSWARRTQYSSSVRENADWVQILLVLSNNRARIREYIPPSGKSNWQVDKIDRNYSMTTNRTIEKRPTPDNKVYCLSVPTGNIVVRLNNNVAITGQCQNIPKTGWGKKIKRAIIPPPGYKWLSADAKNLEYRVALWLSGMDVTTIGWDAFQYILNSAGNIFDKPAAIIGQTPRQVAKTTSYLTLYFGGFRLLDEWELKTARIKRDIAKGILVVFPDWKYFDKIVAFTGIRLADKLFRNHKDESRKAALELQELYFDKLPLRNFHKLATKTAEKGFCQTPWGSYLELIEGLHDDPKVCSSKLGQGIGAEYVQGKQVWYLKNGHKDAIMQLQVHDDITFAVPKNWTDEQCLDFCRPLFSPSHRYPELTIPWEIAVGENNLGEMRVLNHGFI